jgi:hyperosmotically inducible periplasmic protein
VPSNCAGLDSAHAGPTFIVTGNNLAAFASHLICRLRWRKVHIYNEEINAMKKICSPSLMLLGAAILMGGALALAGCHSSHPDEKGAVVDLLKSNNIGSVDVSEDRDKGVITLTGKVGIDDAKQRAANLAQQAAPDYTIANEIGIRPPEADNAGAVASNVDSCIEDNFKAAIKAHQNLNDQSIHASAKNGTLVITGSVKTETQKQEVSTLAQQVPNVQQVVNELDVKPNKHSTPNS